MGRWGIVSSCLFLVACGGAVAPIPDVDPPPPPAPTTVPTTAPTTPPPPPTSTSKPDTHPPAPCTIHTFYRDADGDGFGDPKTATTACSAPAGFVADNTDCYDGNMWAHPGQTGFFNDDRGDGSWDYDCDGAEAPMEPDVDPGYCVCGGGGGFGGCSRSSGWATSVPACGKTDTWNTGAQPDSCDATTEQRTQACR